jgi:uncharacterized protein YdeI (YjbR/CyaY-like superfamily)
MPLKKTINTDAVRSFADPAALRAWLAEHHATVDELWLKMYKKSSGIPSVTWEEVVLEALCWGWIDGIRKTLDAESFVQRLTPRRARSVWSQRNCEHVERLIAAGRMQPPGLAVVEEAKADGRWDKAYAPASTMTLPEDFLVTVYRAPRSLKPASGVWNRFWPCWSAKNAFIKCTHAHCKVDCLPQLQCMTFWIICVLRM